MADFNLGRVAFLDRGAYSPSEMYNKWDFITTTDSTYLCISNLPVINKPFTDSVYWKCIADGKPATLAAALALEKAEEANTAKQGANDAAAMALEKAEEANTAKQGANDAATLATEVAEHPTYIGIDHYVYTWDTATKSYNKTSTYCKGDAFSVSRTYISIAAMVADFGNVEIKEGDFVLITTASIEDPDNSKLYVKGSAEWHFLTDMSGSIGFTGKTPQLAIGNVATGLPGSAATVTLSANGVDASGNPKYLLNYSIPQGAKGDTGKTAYADYFENTTDNPKLTISQWETLLANMPGNELERQENEIARKNRVKQVTGNSETDVMSQKAVTDKFAVKADLIKGRVPADQLPNELIDTTLYLTNVAHRKRRIKDISNVEDSTTEWTLVKGSDYLKKLPSILGLGLYLVSQDLTSHKKLSPTNSNFYLDGSPAALDGSEGDIQMCWRNPIFIKCYEKQEVTGLFEHIEISHLNILGDCEMIPAGGGFPGVMDRATSTLRALYSKDVNYRGGNNASVYDSDPVRTLLGKPASNLSAYSGEVAAKKRGDLWTSGGTPFFATLAILQIMLLGTNNSQAAIVTDDVLVDGEGFQKCKEAAEGLYSGGFGVNNSFPSWDVFNAYNPTFDLSAGFSKGDITGRRVYKINDWPTAGTSQTIQLAYFFGMPWPFNHMWFGDAHQRVDQQTEAQGFKTVVYQKRDITTVPISGGPCENGATPAAPWEKVAEAFRSNGYIRRVSFNALCIIPTLAAGAGASDKFYADYLYNNGETSFGWRAPLRFANLLNGSSSGAFNVYVHGTPTAADANCGAFCCHFSQPQAPKKISKN